MKSGVVFDLDDTLIDRRTTLEAYAHRLWEDFDLELETPLPPFVASFIALDADGRTPPAELFAGLARAFPRSGPHTGNMSRHFADLAWTQPRLASGVAEKIARLRTAGVPIGIITNGEAAGQRRKLQATGLDRLVDRCIISGEFGVEKPDSAIFLAMCSALDIAAEKSWFIGDHPVFDVWGAHRVGFRTIWLTKRVPWPSDRDRCYTHFAPHVSAALDLIASAR